MLFATSPKGEFRKAALNAPFAVMAGDKCVQDGSTIHFIRDGVVVASREITGIAESAPDGAVNAETINHVLFFWRKPVSGVVTTLVDVVKNTLTGAITFKFSNGNSQEFLNGADAIGQTDYLDTTSETAEDVLIRKTMLNSPDETNLRTIIGGKCSIDFNANSPVTLTVE